MWKSPSGNNTLLEKGWTKTHFLEKSVAKNYLLIIVRTPTQNTRNFSVILVQPFSKRLYFGPTFS